MRRFSVFAMMVVMFSVPALVSGDTGQEDVVLRLVGLSGGSWPVVDSLNGSANAMAQTVVAKGFRPQNLQDDLVTWLQNNNQTGRTIHLAAPTERNTGGWTVERKGQILCMQAPDGVATQALEATAFLISSVEAYLEWTTNQDQDCAGDEVSIQ